MFLDIFTKAKTTLLWSKIKAIVPSALSNEHIQDLVDDAEITADVALDYINTAALQAFHATFAPTVGTAVQKDWEQDNAAKPDYIKNKPYFVSEANVDPMYYYGIEFYTDNPSPDCVRIGNMDMHRTLPIQSNMKGCLLNDDGEVVKYLDPDDWTQETRDGSQGQVMVEIPEHYRKFETSGVKRRVMISPYALPGFHHVSKVYVSAYEAALDRTNEKLASVVNTTAQYRGGNNTADWDNTYRSLLGRPVSYKRLSYLRTYARARNQNITNWNAMTYDAWKTLAWLMTIEFATFKMRKPFEERLTIEGFKQGGLGEGVYVGGAYAYNSSNPVVPCGYTDSLGNKSGSIPYDIIASDDSVKETVPVPRYRGIENIYKHMGTLLDGIVVNGDYLYVIDDPAEFADTITGLYSYKNIGEKYNQWGDFFITDIIFGDKGEIVPMNMVQRGGSSSTYFCVKSRAFSNHVLLSPHFSYSSEYSNMFSFLSDDKGYDYERSASRLTFIPTTLKWYGVEWTEANPVEEGGEWSEVPTSCTRIGNMALHKLLPIQSKMRGCLLDDNGNVVKYLDENDWTSEVRNGSQGQVMVEVPKFYMKFEKDGTTCRIKISEEYVQGFKQVPKAYISAYEASLDRTNNKLASVVNKSTQYRGGDNTYGWDDTYRSLLGMPVTNISAENFRTYARNRKANSADWNMLIYDVYKAITWLYVVEYADRNVQQPYQDVALEVGLHTGGLGDGVTTTAISSSAWSTYNSMNPLVPCGVSDTLGNRSGIVNYDVKDGSDALVATVSVPRYRGIENLFGHVRQLVDGAGIILGSQSTDSRFYMSKVSMKYSYDLTTSTEGYEFKGTLGTTGGLVTEIIGDVNSDIVCSDANGSVPSSYEGGYSDYFSITSKGETEQNIVMDVAGYDSNSTLSKAEGLFNQRFTLSPNGTESLVGTRLCFYHYDTVYGIEYNVTSTDPAVTRIGNLNLHESLPIQSKMRGCILNDNGEVVKYLDPNDWTNETRDGSLGQVMVEIPQHWRKFETDGNIYRCLLSEVAVDGFTEVPKVYVGAYEAAMDRTNNKLCSIVNTDAQYRGGDNTDYDGTYRSFLGRPVSHISLANLRSAARARKANSTEWNCLPYEVQKTLFWFYLVEYANRNVQLSFTSSFGANGYHIGGLGDGATTMSDSNWNTLNSKKPFIPCGVTDSLGNQTGVASYSYYKSNGTVGGTLSVARYRGIENFFGHIGLFMEGAIVVVAPSNASPAQTDLYVTDDPTLFNDSDPTGFRNAGTVARASSWITAIIGGAYGDIAPNAASNSGSAIKFFCDEAYTNIPSSGDPVKRALVYNSDAIRKGTSAGISRFVTDMEVSAANKPFGTRLCFIPAQTA